jgi:hypothetical protein
MNFDNMFFSTPAVRKPQNVLQPMATNYVVLINNNTMYGMTKGSRFSNPAVVVPAYKVSPVATLGASILGFNENTKSMIISSYGTSFSAMPASSAALLNTDADIVWMAGYAGTRSAGLALLKYANGTGNLLKLNFTTMAFGGTAGYAPLYDASNPHLVAASHGLMSADVIGGNYDNDYLYYAKGNKVYQTDVVSLPENLQIELPAGETITCMQHVKYPDPPASTYDRFVVASSINGKYKVRFYEISSIGALTPAPDIMLEGEGRIANVIYVEQGVGTRVY